MDEIVRRNIKCLSFFTFTVHHMKCGIFWCALLSLVCVPFASQNFGFDGKLVVNYACSMAWGWLRSRSRSSTFNHITVHKVCVPFHTSLTIQFDFLSFLPQHKVVLLAFKIIIQCPLYNLNQTLQVFWCNPIFVPHIIDWC